MSNKLTALGIVIPPADDSTWRPYDGNHAKGKSVFVKDGIYSVDFNDAEMADTSDPEVIWIRSAPTAPGNQ